MRWPHFHSDPNYQLDGCHYYYVCKCGARRITEAYSNLYGPPKPGWGALLQNRHGEWKHDSGWLILKDPPSIDATWDVYDFPSASLEMFPPKEIPQPPSGKKVE